ncbi:hypothetical protein BN1051_02073 [Arthrobacter saudimassiliensis]|uniref:Ferredoxin n=1 Tax=Arthrobacter saudimassiliensis TaxID=1461584 RepID=A0A078MR32_9MICC|nr:hypothetical protein BN1051_02073 [Arthrobacter saudimassiliensis]
MAAATDTRLLDTPMQPLACRECIAVVQVRKSSWQQTSIQWDADALKACRERPGFCAGGEPAERFAGCETLAASIRQASTEGRLPVIHRDEPEQ